MFDSEEEVPTEGTSKGTRERRPNLEQVLVTMKYKFQGTPIPSKFGSKVMIITDTLMGHIDLDQFHENTFS